MSAIARGTKNAFRNPLRTLSVTVILGISLGLVLVMLTARGAVSNRITEVKKNVGNTVTISPAGARGFLGGGEPLSTSQIASVQSIAHVSNVDAIVDDQMQTGTDTNLQSPIAPGTLGGRQGRLFRQRGSGSTNQPFTLPIFAIGTNNGSYGGAQIGSSITLSSGKMFDASSNDNVAVVGKALADKNTLSVGSTFTAYATTITVKGIYDAGNQFANNSVLFPLKTLQRLSSQVDQVTSAVAHVDSLDNLASTSSAISTKLGSAADVTSSADQVKEAVAPLENIKTITTTSLIGALIAAAVITLLTMVMIVRERRKEIAVLKAIGAGDASIVTQFVTESVVFSLLGSVVGIVLGFILTNPILKALLSSSANQGGAGPRPGGGPTGFGGGAFRFAAGGFRAIQGSVRNIQAVVDWHIILYALLAAVVVAVIGSAFPAWLIGKVRPAEVLRSE